MRAAQLADIEVAARALMAVPHGERVALMDALIWRADTADRFRKRLKRVHPEFGSGTLMSAVSPFPVIPRPAGMNADALDAFATVIRRLQHQSA